MRRFELIGGTSEKFWEVERDGSTVTVHFGRIGTNGQTQAKDLDSDAAATTHLDKLVAEKVKKGYTEVGGAGDASSAPTTGAAETGPVPTPGATAGAADPPLSTAKPEPAATADPPPIASADLPDETTFVPPAAWARQAPPFRGRRPAPDLKIDPEATFKQAEVIRTDLGPAIQAALSNPTSDPNLVAHATLHQGRAKGPFRRTEQEDDALGAAVLLDVILTLSGWSDRDANAKTFLDEIVLRHGAAFATTVGIHLTAVVAMRDPRKPGDPLRIEAADVDGRHRYSIERALHRLRAHLAGVDDATYAQVVQAAANGRDGTDGARTVASYLVPTETAWVDADVAGVGTSQATHLHQLLLASVTTRAQLDHLLAVLHPTAVTDDFELTCGLVANLGLDAVEPLLLALARLTEATTTQRLLKLILDLPTDEAFAGLVERLEQKYVRTAVVEAMGRYPRRALRILAVRAAGSDAVARSCTELLRNHLISHPGLADQVPELDDATRATIDSIAASTTTVPVAGADALPPILVTPPWERRRNATKPTVVAGLTPPLGLSLHWKPGEQEEWATGGASPYLEKRQSTDWGAAVASAVTGDTKYQYQRLTTLSVAPPDLVRPHLANLTIVEWTELPQVKRLLGRLDSDAVGFTVRTVLGRPATLSAALLPIEGAEVATAMADWLVRSKAMRPIARTWLGRHPSAAARDLVPAAVAKPGKERVAAETALRVLDQAGHRETVLDAAGAYGPEARAAVEAGLDADPLDRLPARMPALPAWLDPAHLPQILLPGRELALPPAAVGHICTMFALSKPGDTYAGIAVVAETTDPTSLAEMAWGLFELWKRSEYPAKDGWVLGALGLVGDDETVRRLAPLIRAWPGEAAHARAVAGLDVLSAIGTDVALMHLHGIAEKVKFKGLKTKAREKMDEVAEGLGLSAEQLADRLVPTFGLSPEGSMVLDYGDRRFTVGFDEQLKPIVADEDGSRRKALPKPAAKDDPNLAPAAYAAFTGLKKDVKTIAADQLRRFERAMVTGRRWPAHEQRTLFVDHPLLWHLARRLVWATFDAHGSVTGTFRVAEDRTLADAADEETTVADDILVGVAHPLRLGDQLSAWSEVFADYEILQPFPQLGRDTWALTPEERSAKLLTRMAGVTIETGRILGLSSRGWDRGMVMDGGVAGVVQKTVTGGHVLVIDLDPGLIAGAAMEWKEQTIPEVWISGGEVEWGSKDGERPFSVLDDVTASELLRDLEHLRG